MIKIYDYLKSKGVQTMLWGDKLLTGASIPGAGSVGGDEYEMFTPAYHQKDGKVIGIMPATYQAIDMIPRDIKILHWYWSLGEELENQFLDRGFDIRYGNFEGYFFNNWQEHIRKSNRNGAYISNWSSVNEVILQRNNIFFGISYGYEMFWNHNFKSSDFDSLRDKTFAYLYEYKYKNALELPRSTELQSNPKYVEITYTTDYFVKFKYFVDGVFPEKEVYEIGNMIFEYEDDSRERIPVMYGENIGNQNVKWDRTADGDKRERGGYNLQEHLLEMAMNTLPVKEGNITYFRHIVNNPQPSKKLKAFRVESYPEKNCQLLVKEVQYIG